MKYLGTLAPSLSSSHCSPSDHFPVFTTLSINPSPIPHPTLHSFRRFHTIDISHRSKIISSHNTPTQINGLSLLIAYITTLSSLLDKHVVTKLSDSIANVNVSR